EPPELAVREVNGWIADVNRTGGIVKSAVEIMVKPGRQIRGRGERISRDRSASSLDVQPHVVIVREGTDLGLYPLHRLEHINVKIAWITLRHRICGIIGIGRRYRPSSEKIG